MLARSRRLLISALCGSGLVLAFAPFGLWLLAPILIAIFFAQLSAATAGESFWAGLIFGLGLYLFGASWVYVSLTIYGGMPFWMATIAVLGFAGLLALFIATPVYLSARLFPRDSNRFVALPLLWIVFEWLKSWVLTGFPWLDIGYTQTETWGLGWAPIGGVYLVSLVVVGTAALLAWSFRGKYWWALSVIPMVVAASWGVSHLAWSQAIGRPLHVGIVQANVPINNKWTARHRDQLISQYQSLTERIQAQRTADLIVWPETALPLYMQRVGPDFWQAIKPRGTALLTGVVDAPSLDAVEPSYDETYNAAVLVCDGQTQVYRKRHLVPFGEYMPMRFLFGWVLEYLQLPMSDFSSWQGVQPLLCGQQINIGLSICYEDAFADEYRRHVGDATLLVNISEDAWFGDSFAPHQRMQKAQMRARELSRPMVRSANSGPSAVIDERGNVVAVTSQFEVDTLVTTVSPHTGETPFKRWGNWVIYLSLLVLALMALRVRRA